MKTGTHFHLCWLLVFVFVSSGASAAEQDVPGSRDHPALTRMPGFHIDDYEEQEFDSYDFRGAGGERVRVEGRKIYIDYGLDDGARTPSELQILRNHTNAVEAAGGEVLHEDGSNAYLRLAKEGVEIWVHVRPYNQATSYSLTIIEKEAMAQEVTADAATMARALAQSGKVAVYGIYFDFDKADIKPESEPTLREIAQLLTENRDLDLYIVGHTDNIGELDYNMELSLARARAVVQALTSSHGIAGRRLHPAGVGPLAPVALNTTEDGRALNRRVELVRR